MSTSKNKQQISHKQQAGQVSNNSKLFLPKIFLLDMWKHLPQTHNSNSTDTWSPCQHSQNISIPQNQIPTVAMPITLPHGKMYFSWSNYRSVDSLLHSKSQENHGNWVNSTVNGSYFVFSVEVFNLLIPSDSQRVRTWGKCGRWEGHSCKSPR